LDVKDFVTEYGKQYNEYHNSEVAFKLNPAEMYDEFSKNYYCPDKNEHDTIVPKETTQKEIKQIVKSLNLEEKTILIDMIENQVEKLNKNELTLLRERQKINSKTTEMKNATEVLM